MTGPPRPPDEQPPPEVAGERRLARPPSERFGATAATGRPPGSGQPPGTATAATSVAAPVRGIAFGAIAGLVGAALIVVFGGALAVSAGLLVVASGVGYAVGLATVIGAGDTLSARGRAWIAAALAAIGVILGQGGLWLFARAEGGVLAPIDYLGQTFGPLVPVEVLLAAAVAWWRAR